MCFIILCIGDSGDRNVKIVFSVIGIASAKFEGDSIKALCEYYTQNNADLEKLRKEVEERTNKKCPPFKLLDLVLWSAVNTNNGDENEE